MLPYLAIGVGFDVDAKIIHHITVPFETVSSVPHRGYHRVTSINTYVQISWRAIMLISNRLGHNGSRDCNECLNGGCRSHKVGFVYLTTPGDHGWTYAHELGVRWLKTISAIMLKQRILKMFQKVLMRPAIRIGTAGMLFSPPLLDPTLKVSKEFPNVKFEHIQAISAPLTWRQEHPLL